MAQHLRPSGHARTTRTGRYPADVIDLIMADHRRIRRLSEALEDAARHHVDSGQDWMLAHLWQRLAGLLGAHTRAEEEICYPLSGCSRQDAGHTRDAIDDHEDIREAITEASLQRVGSALWWRAVRAVLATSAGHLDREESDVLPGCLAGLTVSQRRELGRQWLRFIAAWTLDAGVNTSRAPVVRGGPSRCGGTKGKPAHPAAARMGKSPDAPHIGGCVTSGYRRQEAKDEHAVHRDADHRSGAGGSGDGLPP
jgi:Hemerythrin HHE cation binding domain